MMQESQVPTTTEAAAGNYTQPPVIPGGSYPSPGGSTASPADSDKIIFECDKSGKYKAHPIYCNKYYKCEFDGSDWVFPKLTCPKDLVFSEGTQECVQQECIGEMADVPLPLTTQESATTDTVTEETTSSNMVDPSSLFDCPANGYYPFEGDCIRFYKCVSLDSGLLKGLLYRCPEGYGYSESKKRCDLNSRLPTCDKQLTEAHLRLAPARQLDVLDLAWFFNN